MSRSPSFDPHFMRSICASTQKTFSTQLGLDLVTGEPCLWQGDSTTGTAIVGKIDIDSMFFHGSLGIAFSGPVFLAIYEKMFGEACPEITDELQDAAAEFMNIIYGVTKAELNQRPGYDLKPLLPVALRGDALEGRYQSARAIVMIPFQCPLGLFRLEVALHAASTKVAA